MSLALPGRGDQLEIRSVDWGGADLVPAASLRQKMTQSGPKPDRNPALRRAPDLILSNPLSCNPG
jgi:hypothetical protein